MNKGFFVIIMLTAMTIGFMTGYYWHASRSSQAGMLPHNYYNTWYPIYELAPFTMNDTSKVGVPILNSLDLNQKLAALATHVSASFGNNLIKVDSVVQRSGKRIAYIDLIETETDNARRGWYQAFQGTTGGAESQHTLQKTFLQPEYAGDWIDAVQFCYNGVPFDQNWDHIDLSGLKLREMYRTSRKGVLP
jgi:hypothetical protein